MISLFAKKTRSAGGASGWRRRGKTAFARVAVLALALLGTLPQEAPGKADSQHKLPRGPIVLTALIWAPDRAEEMHRIADAFSREHPHIRIDLQFMIGNSIEENLKPKVATDNLPDFFSVNANPYTAALADQALLADLGGIQAWRNMPAGLQDAWTSPDKRHYGVAGGFATTLIYYHRDLFARAGISRLPENFDEFVATAHALKKAGITPLALSGGFPHMLANGPFSYGFANGVAPQVVDWRNRIADGTLPMDTQQGADIFAKLKLLADQKLLQPGFMGASYAETLRMFNEGQAAMTFQGSWAADTLMRNKDAQIGVFMPPWNAPGKPLLPAVGSKTGLALSAHSSPAKRRAALQFIDYLYDRQSSGDRTAHHRSTGIRNDRPNDAGRDQLAILLEKVTQPDTLRGAGLYTSYLPVNTIEQLHGLLQAVLYGTRSPGEAARLLGNSINDQARFDQQ